MSEEGPVSRGKRFMKLATMTASVAGTYTKSRVASVFQSEDAAEESWSATNLANGERIAKTLGELKGAVMKVGQMASAASDLLPKELTEPLKKLQREAPPMSYEVIAQQIEDELGQPPEMLFRSFEKVPFASASIGQVHRAVTDDGREVVVKVQYPGVDKACDSDLAHLKFALKMTGMARNHKKSFDALFKEIRDRLHEELDYCNEADNVRLFGAMHADDEDILVPEVVGERSSKRVLTLTYVPGDRIDECSHYPQDVRDRIGETLYRMSLSQIFRHRAVHADPNPGNFAVRPDGKLIVYDFGCVKRLDEATMKVFADIIAAGLEEDYERLDQNMIEIGARIVSGPKIPEDFYARWRAALMEPCIRDEFFDFDGATLHEEVARQVTKSLKYINAFQPPASIAYINRTVGGYYHNLRAFSPKVRWKYLVSSYVYEALGVESPFAAEFAGFPKKLTPA